MGSQNFALAIHGGAYCVERDYGAQESFLKDVLQKGYEMLSSGALALDVAVEAVRMLEDAGLYVAGKGSGPNRAGYYELDASVMEGHTRQVGAVASLRRFQNPVYCARTVMDKSKQALFAAEGAENFLLAQGIVPLADPPAYFEPIEKPKKERDAGTVGAVVCDQNGHLAAATSTGGLPGKPEGRVGDTPLIGAATWADETVALSTTGHGEYFIRSVAAHDVAARMRYGAQALDTAVQGTLTQIQELGGWGGMISVDKTGAVYCGHVAKGMHHGWVRTDGMVCVPGDQSAMLS